MLFVKKLGTLAGILLVFMNVILPSGIVHAQAANGGTGTTTRPPLNLTTSPIPLSIVTKPGQTVTADLRVKNNSTRSEKLKIELLKFSANGETGTPQLRDREAKDTYFNWVSFNEPTFTADPNVWKTVKMTIKTPPEAAFGYYLAVLFSRASPDKPTGGASGVEGGVASLVLLDVETPGAKREAKVVSLTSTKKVYEFLPADLEIRLKNSGNIHVSPTGSIFISRGGQKIAMLDFNTQRGNILPNSSRLFKSSWNDGFPSYVEHTEGSKTTRSLQWDFSKLQKFRIGHYSATLVAVYDDGQRDVPVEATVSFWVIPWRILGVALATLLLIGLGLWFSLRGLWSNIRRPRNSKKSDSGSNDPPTAGSHIAGDSVASAPSPLPPAAPPTLAIDPLPKTTQKSVEISTEKSPAAPGATGSPEPTTAPELSDE